MLILSLRKLAHDSFHDFAHTLIADEPPSNLHRRREEIHKLFVLSSQEPFHLNPDIMEYIAGRVRKNFPVSCFVNFLPPREPRMSFKIHF